MLKKKLMLVVPTLSTGGGEKLVCDLGMYIDKSKFDIYVVVLYSEMRNLKENRLRKAGVNLVFLNQDKVGKIKTLFNVRKTVNQIKPDIIHSHLDAICYLLTSYKRYQKKLHTIHSMAEFEATGIRKYIRFIAFYLYRVTPIAIGETVKESISSYYKIPKDKIPCVYNGVKASSELKNVIRKDDDEVIIVNIGTLYYVKNQLFLIEAVKECVKRTKKKVRLLIIGDGKMKSQIESEIKKYSLDNIVSLIGWTDNVNDYLIKSDIYICSSLMEGVSLAIIEAMMVALPIIASDVGGNQDLVKDGINGFLYNCSSCSELIEAMLKLIENSKLREQMGYKSLEMSKKFVLENCVLGYENLYLQ